MSTVNLINGNNGSFQMSIIGDNGEVEKEYDGQRVRMFRQQIGGDKIVIHPETSISSVIGLKTAISMLTPKDLSNIPALSIRADKSKAFVYVDNNGSPSKTSIDNFSSIKTVDEEPTNISKLDYIFLRIEGETI